jgi:hypothetical protein
MWMYLQLKEKKGANKCISFQSFKFNRVKALYQDSFPPGSPLPPPPFGESTGVKAQGASDEKCKEAKQGDGRQIKLLKGRKE